MDTSAPSPPYGLLHEDEAMLSNNRELRSSSTPVESIDPANLQSTLLGRSTPLNTIPTSYYYRRQVVNSPLLPYPNHYPSDLEDPNTAQHIRGVGNPSELANSYGPCQGNSREPAAKRRPQPQREQALSQHDDRAYGWQYQEPLVHTDVLASSADKEPKREDTGTAVPLDMRATGAVVPVYSEAEAWLRQQSFLATFPAELPLHLNYLQDPTTWGSRPPYSMHQLAAIAILSHPRKRARSAEIRDMLQQRYPYFRENGKELGETLKHTLSSYYIFRLGKAKGKGGIWELDVVTNPTGRRTRRRRSSESDTSISEEQLAQGGFFPGASKLPVSDRPSGAQWRVWGP